MRELLSAVREGRRSVVLTVAGVGASVASNLLGALAAPPAWQVPLYVAGVASALVALAGFADALLAGHRLRARIEWLEDEVAIPIWQRELREQETWVSAMLAPTEPVSVEGGTHPL